MDSSPTGQPGPLDHPTSPGCVWLVVVAVGLFVIYQSPLLLHGSRVVTHDAFATYSNFHFVARCMRQGELPLWDPFTHAGQPYLYQFIVAPSGEVGLLLAALVDRIIGGTTLDLYLWYLAAHFLVFALGMHWLARLLLRGPAGPLMVLSTVLLGSTFGQVCGQDGVIEIVTFLPLEMALVVRLAGPERSPREWAALALVLAVHSLSSLLFVPGLYALALFAAVHCALNGRRSGAPGPSRRFRVVAAALVALVAPRSLAIVMDRSEIVPSLRVSLSRTDSFPDGGFLATPEQQVAPILPQDLARMVSPLHVRAQQILGRLFRRIEAASTLGPPSLEDRIGIKLRPGRFSEYLFFPGLVGLFLALVGVFEGRRGLVLPVLVPTVWGLWIALGPDWGLSRISFHILPLLSTVHTLEHFAVFGLAIGLPLMAGIGAERVEAWLLATGSPASCLGHHASLIVGFLVLALVGAVDCFQPWLVLPPDDLAPIMPPLVGLVAAVVLVVVAAAVPSCRRIAGATAALLVAWALWLQPAWALPVVGVPLAGTFATLLALVSPVVAIAMASAAFDRRLLWRLVLLPLPAITALAIGAGPSGAALVGGLSALLLVTARAGFLGPWRTGAALVALVLIDTYLPGLDVAQNRQLQRHPCLDRPVTTFAFEQRRVAVLAVFPPGTQLRDACRPAFEPAPASVPGAYRWQIHRLNFYRAPMWFGIGSLSADPEYDLYYLRPFWTALKKLPLWALRRVAGVDRDRLGFATRVRVATDHEVVESVRAARPGEELPLFLAPGEAAPTVADRASPPGGALTLRVTHSGPGEVRIAARVPVAGYVTLADGYTADWRCTVDGEPTPVRRANLAFRAVHVREGAHEIVFRYVPVRHLAGVGLALVGIAGLGLLTLVTWVRHRPGPAA
ncbi:MAG: hypothetical protein HY815_11885 [Candidatus Riflebacteria bacterium]|nr:hypothetical protein [Candidatus Riflebacteria bacterium]